MGSINNNEENKHLAVHLTMESLKVMYQDMSLSKTLSATIVLT